MRSIDFSKCDINATYDYDTVAEDLRKELPAYQREYLDGLRGYAYMAVALNKLCETYPETRPVKRIELIPAYLLRYCIITVCTANVIAAEMLNILDTMVSKYLSRVYPKIKCTEYTDDMIYGAICDILNIRTLICDKRSYIYYSYWDYIYNV